MKKEKEKFSIKRKILYLKSNVRNKEIIKTLILIVLFVITIMQVKYIWHSSANSEYEAEEVVDEAYSHRLVVNNADVYNVLYNGLEDLELYQALSECTAYFLHDGKYVDTIELSTYNLYDFDYSIEFIYPMSNEKAEPLIEKPKKYVNKINYRVDPNTYTIQVDFIDYVNDKVYCYEIVSQEMTNSISNANLAFEYEYNSDASIIKYNQNASVVSGTIEDNSNLYVPVADDSLVTKNLIAYNSSYNGEMLLENIKVSIIQFFDNPLVIEQGVIDGVFTYRDEYTVVKYYPNDVLEYYNYNVHDDIEDKTLLEEYNIAIDFIEEDKYVVNEVFLADIYQTPTETTFYFDYVINNFVLCLTEQEKEELSQICEIQHFIEVTVSNGEVIKYKKLAINFDINSYDYDFLYSDDEYQNYVEEYEDITLKYLYDGEDYVKLYWNFNNNGDDVEIIPTN